MKGIVFTELIEMVEKDLGIDIADRMITGAKTSNNGAYTSVGTYDHGELIRMVISLAEETGIGVPNLVRAFGRHLFTRFQALYPHFFQGVDSATQFLPMIETYIHVEVRKLYPDAELPTFTSEFENDSLHFTYTSTRPFADLAEGLVLACVDHFGDEVTVVRTDLGSMNGTQALFVLQPLTAHAVSRAPVQCPI